jgi:ferric-dicitrate binding protein FerR (iron transport regulator)
VNRSCEQWREALAAGLFGELSDSEVQELESHVVSCPECRASRERARRTLGELKALPVEEAPEDLEARLLTRLVTELGSEASASEAQTPVAEAVRVVGAPRRVAVSGSAAEPLESGSSLAAGEGVELDADARVLLRLSDRSELWVNGGTRLEFARRAREAFVSVIRGEVLAFVPRQCRALPILTPAGIVSVTGTVFDTAVDESDQVRVAVLQGAVEVINRSGRHRVGARQLVSIPGPEWIPRRSRMSNDEILCLTGWAKPLNLSSRTVVDGVIKENGRDDRRLALWALLWFALGAALAALLLGPLRGDRPPLTGTRSVTAAMVAGEEPIDFWLELTPGTQWTENVRIEDSSRTSHPRWPEDSTLSVGQFSHTLRVQAPTERGTSQIENEVLAAESWLMMGGRRREHEDLGATDPLASLVGFRFVDPIDRHGLVDVGEWRIPEDKDEVGAIHRGVFASLRYDVPERLLRVGEEWSREITLPGVEGAKANWTSRLERLEEIDGRWVAVISRDVEVDLEGPFTWTSPRPEGSGAEERLHSLRVDLTAEGRFLIEEGRWLDHRMEEVRREDFTPLADGAPESEGAAPAEPEGHRVSRTVSTIEILDFQPAPEAGQ